MTSDVSVAATSPLVSYGRRCLFLDKQREQGISIFCVWFHPGRLYFYQVVKLQLLYMVDQILECVITLFNPSAYAKFLLVGDKKMELFLRLI